MSYLIAALLGLVQGITEILPLSGSGHLALLRNIFHIQEADLMLDVMFHVGTMIAIFGVYRQDVRGLFRGAMGLLGTGRDSGSSRPSAQVRRRMALLVILGTLPLVLVLPFRTKLLALADNSLLVSCMLLLTGLVLYLSDRTSANGKQFKNITLPDVLLVGLGQAVGAIPGISRAGCCISVGLFRGFQRSFAVKFAFLLAVPSMLGDMLVKFIWALKQGFDPGMIPAYFVGMITAAISATFCLRILRWAAARNRMGGFAYYCWGAGIVALLLSLVA